MLVQQHTILRGPACCKTGASCLIHCAFRESSTHPFCLQLFADDLQCALQLCLGCGLVPGTAGAYKHRQSRCSKQNAKSAAQTDDATHWKQLCNNSGSQAVPFWNKWHCHTTFHDTYNIHDSDSTEAFNKATPHGE